MTQRNRIAWIGLCFFLLPLMLSPPGLAGRMPVAELFTDSGQALGDSVSHEVALGDLDGDDDLDAFVAKSGANQVWFNDGRGFFSDSGQFLGTSISYGVALGDLDGDKDLDAFVANRGTVAGAPDRVWLNDGGGKFNVTLQTLGDLSSYGVALGDVDQDQDLDAFVAACGDAMIPPVNANTLWINDGTGNFSDSGLDFGTACSTAAEMADLNDDQRLDIVFANAGSPNPPLPSRGVEIWVNQTVSSTVAFSRTQIIDLTYNFDIALGDLNGDLAQDIFIANGEALGGVQPNHVWLNDGKGTFVDTMQLLGSAASNSVALGDFDLDGDLDAFVGNGSYQQGLPNTVWLNDGAGMFADSGQNMGGQNTLSVAVGDLDGDTDLDAFVANDQADQVWFNNTNPITRFFIYLPAAFHFRGE